MKAYILDRPGAPDTLRLADMPVPQPKRGEVRVKVGAVALNPVDYKVAARGHSDWTFPFILGLDVAGVIDAVGEGVADWAMGERVYYHGDLRKNGGYAEYAVIDADALARIPAVVSFTQAAALPTAGFTAYQAIHRKGAFRAGQTILIHGGSGGVGGFAIQLAKRLGLQIFTTGSPKNFDKVKALGAAAAIDYNGDVAAEIGRLTNGRGVDIVIDTVSAASATESYHLLAHSGHLVCVVGLPDFTVWKPFEKAASVHELALGAAHASGDRAAVRELGRIAEELVALVAAGDIDPLVGETAPFDALPDALGRLQRREVASGKVVIALD
ncbi:MAG TPA: zinc-binding dehydrogenase [Patescibacteria group bacterium]|nr:zinc-binding dehydrogenase [Patescibacteria group bacterium]